MEYQSEEVTTKLDLSGVLSQFDNLTQEDYGAHFEIIPRVAYLIGVRKWVFENEHEPPKPWNGAPPKYDIREWSPDHEKMGKGITLTVEEAEILKELL